MIHFTLVIRRYAPFESFGGGFEGDNRNFSMDLNATARTTGKIAFVPGLDGNPTSAGLSSGSSYLGPFAMRKGSTSIIPSVGEVRVTVSNIKNDNANMSFSVQTSGNIPLKDLMLKKGISSMIDRANHWLRPESPKPDGSPDIDTYVDFWVRTSPTALNVHGTMRGTAFPTPRYFYLMQISDLFHFLTIEQAAG